MDEYVEIDQKSNILYDLTIQSEWQLEPEAVCRPTVQAQGSLSGRLTSTASRSAWTFLRSVGVPVRTGSPCSLPPALVKLINSHMSWHFAVTADGRQVAILQDHALEIRTWRDDFAGVFARCAVARDAQPQWRCVSWAPGGHLVAVADSVGAVTVLDIMATKIAHISTYQAPNPNVPTDLSRAVCGLIFLAPKKGSETDGSSELLIVNYQGTLKKYTIRRDAPPSLCHTFSLSGQYPRGVSAVTYSPTHSLLLVGGQAEVPGERPGSPTAAQLGLTAWRLLSDLPHYQLVTDYSTDLRHATSKTRLLNKLRHLYRWDDQAQDGIYKLCLSPNGLIVAAVHQFGGISFLDVPSLRLRHFWDQEQQPLYNEVNQSIAENPKKSKAYKEQLTAFFLTDVNWWSEMEVILARGTGAVTVSCADTLANRLGPSPEWFEAAPLLSSAHNGGFLGLECEAKLSVLKRHRVSDDDDQYEDSDDDGEGAPLVTRSAKYMRQVLYYVTDSDKFQPPRKRPKMVTKTYRLICLKSTTPEELYERKIENEEYGEALALARAYGLDGDRVYQRQWRANPVSVATIQDYLSKISKRSWVLHECLERVPDNIDAMRELLHYGLRGTDLEALLAIGRGEDGGRFILCDRHDVYEDSIIVDPFNTVQVEEAKAAETRYVQELLDQVHFSTLSLQQVELCRARDKLVQYVHRLSTYEEILGGSQHAPERYEPKFFENFRSANIVELATQYARDCDVQAVDTLFTYHGADLLKHRLAILSNFPETLAPHEYSYLLPEIDVSSGEMMDWVQHEWKDPDWCRLEEARAVVDPSPPDYGAFLYEENPDLTKFRGVRVSSGQLSAWYSWRAQQVESLSRQVDHSLELISLARSDKHIPDLDLLHDDLVTMDTLVYECLIDDAVTLQHFLDMPPLDRLLLMMASSSPEMYSKNIKRWLVPFLNRYEQHSPGTFGRLMREYLVTLSKTDLSRCLQIFETCRADQPKPVIGDEELVMSMALECVYTCQSSDQLSNAYSILECLPQRGFGIVTEQSTKLHNQVDQLECHLSAAEILEKHDLPQQISVIKNTQQDAEESKALFIKLTRKACNNRPLSDKEWRKLLSDVLRLRDKVYHCVDQRTVYQIFVESLLCSSNTHNISLAGRIMERSSAESRQPDYVLPDSEEDDIIKKVAYSYAVDLVLSAAREYFDSSTNLTDTSMDLARSCLGLIEDRPSATQDELDLIDALALLDGFGVNILPLQVRMCKNRLELIERSIAAKAFTYKNSQRLLKLGQLLKVPGENKVDCDGQVLCLIAQAALKARDVGVAYHTCHRVMEMGYHGIWTECMQLAESEDFNNIQAKTELLSFAVTHCSPEMIEPILRAKCLLETQCLYERVHTSLTDRDSPSDNPFTTRGAIQQTRELLSTTNKATRQVLSSVSDAAWWRRTLTTLQPRDAVTPDAMDHNEDLGVQGVHPFYHTLVPHGHDNTVEVDYSAYRATRPDLAGLHLRESLLYTAALEDTLSEGARYTGNHGPVLLQLADDTIAVDSSLGLAYLLALPEPTDAEQCFQNKPGTAVSLQLAAYYYALQMYARLDPTTASKVKPMYHYAPAELVQKMHSHVSWREERGPEAGRSTGTWDEEFDRLVTKLRHYSDLLADYNQALVLNSLNRGIDIGRFTMDADYKKETILGLAMSTEDQVYQISVSLATRYKLPLWDVYMAHLEHLFESGIPTEDLERRVNQLKLLPTLQTDGPAFYTHMAKYVYPTICGTDHDRLTTYYSMLVSGHHGDDRITPANHVKLLKKVKHAAPGLDYAKLTDGQHDPLDVLQPVLTADNIAALAKVATKIPNQHGGFLQASVVYCGWAIQTFWHGTKKRAADKVDWLHRYEACGEYLQKLVPEDVLKFVYAVTFSADAQHQLVQDVRRQIIRRALKYSRQQNVSSKKKDAAIEAGASWEEVCGSLQQTLEHLDRLSHPALASLAHHHADLYDLTRARPHQLHDLYQRMVVEGCSPEDVSKVISIYPGESWTTSMAYTHSIDAITRALRDAGAVAVYADDQDQLAVLRTVVSQVGDHTQHGGNLVTSEDLMSLLRPFCADSGITVDKRLEVLTILEQCFALHAEDLVLLTLYRTEAVVSTAWHQRPVSEADIGSPECRAALLRALLCDSVCLAQYRAVLSLLTVWPHNPTTHSCAVWSELLCQMVSACGPASADDVMSTVRRLQSDHTPLTDQGLASLQAALLDQQMTVVAVKCLLLCDDQDHTKAVCLLSQTTQVAEEDEELFTLLLQRHLTSSIVDSVFYPKLVEFILASQSPNGSTPYHVCVDTVANQLHDVGKEVEAGSLIARHRGMHAGLRTFDAAIEFLNHCINK